MPIVRCPSGVVRDQQDTVQCPADITRFFTCNVGYIYIKVCHHSSKETGCQIRKNRLTLTVIEMKSTLSRQQKKSKALVPCMLITISRSGEFFLHLCFWSSEEKYLCRYNMYFCKTCRFSPVKVQLIKHRPVPGQTLPSARRGIGRFVMRFLKVPGVCQTLYDARTVAIGRVRFTF